VRFAQPFEEAPSRENRTGIPIEGPARRWQNVSQKSTPLALDVEKQSQQVNAITFGQAE